LKLSIIRPYLILGLNNSRDQRTPRPFLEHKNAKENVMRNRALFLAVLSSFVLLPLASLFAASAPAEAATPACQFRLGFLQLQSQIPDIVGNCLDNDYVNVTNGDTNQDTTNGQLVWRKADGVLAFTNGANSWVVDPNGNVQERDNDERFAWEFNGDGLPVVGQSTPAIDGPCPVPPIPVVAVENFYGNLVQQLGGQCISLVSIITDPLADPHEYQPTANDAKSYQTAQFIVENGLGYDDFSDKIIATLSQKPTVLNVGQMLGLPVTSNPHVWYNPTYVGQIIQAINTNLDAVNPAAASYYDNQAAVFNQRKLAGYNASLALLKGQYAGVPVGATESIFVYLAQATGLNLLTPPAFMDAISESNDPTAKDIATFQNQITTHQIKVLVYNSQTITPVTDQLKALAIANNLPIVGVSETMPLDAQTFQGWQANQLQNLIRVIGGLGN
jgi:zinc/manganese transport system substrate-binding protein